MRITTWNINGLRAAWKKGLASHLERIAPDVACFQEIRCTEAQLPKDLILPTGKIPWYHPAEKLGWSGTAVWSTPEVAREGIGLFGTDLEGRVMRFQVGGLRIVNVYLPSGSAGPEKQLNKERFMEDFFQLSKKIAADPHPTLIVGDLNIAHTVRDVFNARTASSMSGFLPHEREWFSELLHLGIYDVVRDYFGPLQGPYTWWSNFGRARAENRGWRIDHVLSNAAAKPWIRAVSIDREAGLACSDHAPISVDVQAP